MVSSKYEPASNRFAKIEADLLLLKWMVGFNLAIGIAMSGASCC